MTSITVESLHDCLGRSATPLILDVRRRQAFAADDRMLPTATWRDIAEIATWSDAIPRNEDVVVYCVHGQNVSQMAASVLAARGIRARFLAGGIDAWQAAGAPTMLRSALPDRHETTPSRWITRVRPKIDRIACPWLIRRFIDARAELHFVEPRYVLDVARELPAIPYDVEGGTFTHQGELCTFDTLLAHFGIVDPALDAMALVIRGADTHRFDLAPEAAGLLAISLGISVTADADDRMALALGFPVYDALYAWRRHASTETHNWPATRT